MYNYLLVLCINRGGQVSGDEYNSLQKEIALLDRKEKQLDQLIRNAGLCFYI